MTETFLLGAALGALAGGVLVIPGILLETMGRTKNLPLVLDIKEVWEKKLTENEIFLLSVFIHLVFSAGAGFFYIFCAERGWIDMIGPPYTFSSVMIFALFAWIIMGAMLYPILGFGFFARKEGKHMWFEMLVTNVLLGVLLWLGFTYYQPFFF